MAKFNPDTGLGSQAPDWTGASQGLPTNRAFEILMEGAGSVIEGAARTKDFKIQSDIRQEVENVFDATNDQSNTSKVAQIIAPELSADPEVEKAVRMTEAYKQGAMSDSHYYSNFTALTKKLRARYPGYNEQIDQIIGEVTGFRPANAFKAAVDAEYEASVKAAQDRAKAQDKWIEDDAQYIYQIDANFEANRGIYESDPTKLAELKMQVGRLKAEEQQVKVANAKSDLDAKFQRTDQEKEVRLRGDHIINIVQNNMRKLYGSVGAGGADMAKVLERFTTQGPTDEEAASIIGAFNKTKVETAAQIDAYLDTYLPESKTTVRSLIGTEAAAKLKTDAMEHFAQLEQLLGAEKWDLANWWAQRNQVRTDRDISTTMTKVPATRVGAALSKISPALADEWALQNREASDVVRTITVDSLLGTFSGEAKMDDVIKTIEESGATQDEKNQALTNFLKGVTTTFESAEASDSAILEFVNQNFKGAATGTAPVDKFWSLIDNKEDREKVFAMLTNPKIADRIAGLGDPALMQDFAAWVGDAISVVPSVTDAARMVVEQQQPLEKDWRPSSHMAGDKQPFEITYDPSKRILVAVPSEPNADPVRQAVVRKAMNSINSRLAGINMVLSNAGYVFEKAGMDPDQEIQRILQDLRISSGSPRTGTLFDKVLDAIGKGTQQQEDGGDKGSDGPFGSSPDSGSLELFPNLASYTPEDGTPAVNETIEFVNSVAENSQNNGATDLHNFIGGVEAPKGYNQIFGKNREAPLDKMTIDEVIGLQTSMLRRGSPSTAVGRYQFLRKTLRSLKEQLGLTGDELLTPELQDRLATQLMKGRGLDKFLSGELTAESFADNLSKEWASLPYRTGRSYYAGDGLNKSLVSREALLEQLNKMASRG